MNYGRLREFHSQWLNADRRERVKKSKFLVDFIYTRPPAPMSPGSRIQEMVSQNQAVSPQPRYSITSMSSTQRSYMLKTTLSMAMKMPNEKCILSFEFVRPDYRVSLVLFQLLNADCFSALSLTLNSYLTFVKVYSIKFPSEISCDEVRHVWMFTDFFAWRHIHAAI